MEWSVYMPKDRQPTLSEIESYIREGGETGGALWTALTDYMQTAYQAKPKLFHSGCSGKPGWNVKYQKSGQGFGTLYPEPGGFSVLLVVPYRLDAEMEAALPTLRPEMAERWRTAGDYMKMGRWMMFPIRDEADLNDYKAILAVKLPPKAR